jgi:hypothetical protein
MKTRTPIKAGALSRAVIPGGPKGPLLKPAVVTFDDTAPTVDLGEVVLERMK